MTDIVLIVISGLLVYIVGYPLVEWFHKIKEEMDDKDDDSK